MIANWRSGLFESRREVAPFATNRFVKSAGRACDSCLLFNFVKQFVNDNQIGASGYWRRYSVVTAKEIDKALRVQQAFQKVLDNPEAAKALEHPALKPLLAEAAD